ncbi:unnamed protein product [Orchesella dallaii]|uniref:Odorant receptor n=1 Tax=Orchesella dallaii TaxID=48710 RepID=A0ABP1RHD0_9HEXA
MPDVAIDLGNKENVRPEPEPSGDPVLSPLIMGAMYIYKFTHGLIPPIIVDIVVKENGVQFKLQKFNFINVAWVLFLFITGLVICSLSGFLLLKKFYFPKETNVDILDILFLIGNLSVGLFLFVLIINALVNHNLIYYLNVVLANQMELRYKRYIREGMDTPGILLFNYMFWTNAIGHPMALILSCFGRNIFYKIFEELYLPHPYHQTELEIIFFSMFSLVILQGGFCIFFKAVGIGVTVASLLLVTLTAYMKTLIGEEIPQKLFLRYYIHLEILGAIGRKFTSNLCLHFVAWTIPFFSIVAWFTIRCAKIMPPTFIVAAALCFIDGMGLAIQITSEMAKVREFSSVIVRSERSRFHSFNTKKYSFYYTLKWRAQQALPAYCGENFVMSKEAVVIYVRVFVDTVINLLLLVRP